MKATKTERKKLRAAREEKGFTQEEMANMVGYKSKSQYSMMENGQRGVSVELAILISRFLEKPIEELFNAEEVHVLLTNKIENNLISKVGE